jgi:CRISPR/Cas system endoribonuclease Cas6 (RAMP superfamily)
MRLLLQLKAAKDQIYENSYNRNIQAFVYNLLKDTQYDYLHDVKKLTKNHSDDDRHIIPFCFSSIFPYGTMKCGHIRNLIISSPDECFISVLQKKNESYHKAD